jgi:hypothetical protein
MPMKRVNVPRELWAPYRARCLAKGVDPEKRLMKWLRDFGRESTVAYQKERLKGLMGAEYLRVKEQLQREEEERMDDLHKRLGVD